MPRFPSATIRIDDCVPSYTLKIQVRTCVAMGKAGATMKDSLAYLQACVGTNYETFLNTTREWVNVK